MEALVGCHPRDTKMVSGGSTRGARGALPPLFLGQTEARRAEKNFWTPPPLPPSYLRVWMTLFFVVVCNFSYLETFDILFIV